MKKTIQLLSFSLMALLGAGAGPQFWPYQSMALAAPNASELVALEQQTVDNLKERIGAISNPDEKEAAQRVLDYITGTEGEWSGSGNPKQRDDQYESLGWALVMPKDAERLAALEAMAKKLGYKGQSNEVPPDEDDDDTTSGGDDEKDDNASSSIQDQKDCTSKGGSWSYGQKSCKLPPKLSDTNPNNTKPGGLVGGTGKGGGQQGGGGGGGPMSSGGGGGGYSDTSSSSAAPGPDSSGNGHGIPISEASQCGPDGSTKLPANTLPSERAKMCGDAARGLLNGVQADCAGQMDKKASERTGECKTISEAAEKTFREAAGFSDDKDTRKQLCEEAKKNFKSDTESWEECKPPQNNCLAKAREPWAKELNNSCVAAFFDYQISKEVGSQGRAAQVAYIETVMNRATSRVGRYARYTSFWSTTNDPKFYPGVSLNYGNKVDCNRSRKYDALVQYVLKGSNTCKYATGNASESVGVGKQTCTFGGERFGIETPDAGWVEKKLKPMCGGSL
ncbi:MAG TPA: hypothetical protein PLO23_04795 [Alphaproteobacteria bacterium]|nr:hypothetical protein [Alphaproteobacteria bacterium]